MNILMLIILFFNLLCIFILLVNSKKDHILACPFTLYPFMALSLEMLFNYSAFVHSRSDIKIDD